MNYYYSGQGSLYVAERDTTTGKPKGFVAVGNVPELTIDISVTKFEHKESETGNRLLDLVITKEKKGAFKFKLENISLDNLALGFYGETAAVVGATVANEVHTAYVGKRIPLDHPDVSAVTVTDVAGTTTYVLNTDYTLDATNGVIIIPATGGTIADASVIHVDYTYAGYNKLDAFTQSSSPERWLRFEGLNTVDDSRVIIDIFRAQFDPLTNYGLINEDIAALDMGGAILADSFQTSGSQFFRQRNL